MYLYIYINRRKKINANVQEVVFYFCFWKSLYSLRHRLTQQRKRYTTKSVIFFLLLGWRAKNAYLFHRKRNQSVNL